LLKPFAVINVCKCDRVNKKKHHTHAEILIPFSVNSVHCLMQKNKESSGNNNGDEEDCVMGAASGSGEIMPPNISLHITLALIPARHHS
jgi:hypothetical protein